MAETDIETVRNWPVPSCSKDVESFLGLANYHRFFIMDFARIAVPLYRVTGKQEFAWEEDQQLAFKELKTALLNPPVLALPDNSNDFVLDVDASEVALGGELIQVHDGQEKVVAYGSFALTSEQRCYCTTRKELLAIVRFTRQWRHYLLERPFVIQTDHSSLTWLLNFKEPQGQIARWMEELSQPNMILKHRKGKNHCNADALSRVQADQFCKWYSAGVGVQDLPCGGCAFCTKAQAQWSAFSQEVDGVVGLACRSVRELGELDYEKDSEEGQAEEPMATLEVSPRGQSVKLVTTEKADPVIKEVKIDGPPSVWGLSVEEMISAQTKDED